MWTFEAREEKQAKERKKGIGRRGKGELKTKIEGAAKQWIENDPTTGWKEAHTVGNKPKLWGKKGCPNRDEWAANSQQMGLQSVRKRDENKGKKKG